MLLPRIRRAASAVLLAGAFTMTSCATRQSGAPQYVPFMRVDAQHGVPAHDAVFYPSGEVDYFPDRAHPRRLIVHRGVNGTAKFSCLNGDCTDIAIRTHDIPGTPDSANEYIFLDHRVAVVRDTYTGEVTGYVAFDSKGSSRQCETLAQAEKFAHAQDLGPQVVNAGEQVGKTVLEVALVAALVVGVVAVAAAEGAAAGGYAPPLPAAYPDYPAYTPPRVPPFARPAMPSAAPPPPAFYWSAPPPIPQPPAPIAPPTWNYSPVGGFNAP